MQRLRKISTILLSILMLLSSTSYSFGLHICMGQLESIALFSGAEPCEMAVEKTPCTSEEYNHGGDVKITSKGCCQDHNIVVEGSEELSVTSSLIVPDVQMVAVLYGLYSFLFSAAVIDYYSSNDYSPPLIERDIPVLIQSFLL